MLIDLHNTDYIINYDEIIISLFQLYYYEMFIIYSFKTTFD